MGTKDKDLTIKFSFSSESFDEIVAIAAEQEIDKEILIKKMLSTSLELEKKKLHGFSTVLVKNQQTQETCYIAGDPECNNMMKYLRILKRIFI